MPILHSSAVADAPNPPAISMTATPTSATAPQQLPIQANTTVAVKPWPPASTFSSHNGSGPSFHQFSASTEEILKRVSANASAHAGSPGWEAAREQVLKSMVTSDKIPTPPPTSGSSRRGRGGGKVGTPSGLKGEVPTSGTTPASTSTPTSGRGRGSVRGRGRGGGRSGKRKRADSAESEVRRISTANYSA
jgi:hypothetical protein